MEASINGLSAEDKIMYQQHVEIEMFRKRASVSAASLYATTMLRWSVACFGIAVRQRTPNGEAADRGAQLHTLAGGYFLCSDTWHDATGGNSVGDVSAVGPLSHGSVVLVRVDGTTYGTLIVHPTGPIKIFRFFAGIVEEECTDAMRGQMQRDIPSIQRQTGR